MGFYQWALKTCLKFKEDYNPLPLREFYPQNSSFFVISNTALGDTLMSLPALKSLKSSFPTSKIIALIHQNWVPLLKDCPYVDVLLPYKRGLIEIFKLIKKVKKLSPKVAIILHGNYPEDICLSVYSGAPWILKSRCKPEYEKFLSFKNVPSNLHAIEKRVLLIKALGGKKIFKDMDLNYLRSKIETIKTFNLPTNKLLLGFQLGASNLSRAWPIKNFVKLANILNETLDCFFILTGSLKEKKQGKMFEKLYGKKNYLNLVGKLSVLELAKVISDLDILVTPDTGPLHLAIALKTPTVSLFALSKPSDTGPIQDLHMHKVIYKPEGLKFLKPKRKKISNEAMDLITVEEVKTCVLDLLKSLKRL